MSRTLYILRHAKASHENFFPGDFYRTLDATGYKESMEIAHWINGKKIKPDLFISSPAIRAYSTALIFAKQLNYPIENIQLDESIYDATLNNLYNILNEISEKYKSVVITGHNPGLTDLINSICGPTTSNLPTSGIAAITFKKKWNELEPGSGTVLYIKSP